MTTLKPCPIPWCLSSNVEIVGRRRFQARCCNCGTYAPIQDSEEGAAGIWNDRDEAERQNKKRQLSEAIKNAGGNELSCGRAARKLASIMQGGI